MYNKLIIIIEFEIFFLSQVYCYQCWWFVFYFDGYLFLKNVDIVKFIENFCMRIGIYVELGMVECVFDWWNDNCKLNNDY